MALVTYSSSASSSEAEDGGASAASSGHARKKRRLSPAEGTSATKHGSGATAPATTCRAGPPPPPPPPPPSFANLYATAVRASVADDPSLHAGRARSSPHVAGQWPSHVYIEWSPTAGARRVLERVIGHGGDGSDGDGGVAGPESDDGHHGVSALNHSESAAAAAVRSLLVSPLGAPAPLHISLSRTLPLRGQQRDAFRARLRAALRPRGRRAFAVRPRSVRWVDNGLRTRAFLVLHVVDAADGPVPPDRSRLGAVLRQCNAVAAEFGFLPLYAEPPAGIGTGMGTGTGTATGNGGGAGSRKPEEEHGENKDGTLRLSGTEGKEHAKKKATENGTSTGTTGSPNNAAAPPNHTSPPSPSPPNPEAKCHVSIAWRLPRSPPSSLSTSAPQTPDNDRAIHLPAPLQAELEALVIPVTTVKLKMGNVIEDIPLAS